MGLYQSFCLLFVCLSVARSALRRERYGGLILSEKSGINCVIAQIDVPKKSVQQKCFFPKSGGKRFVVLSPHAGRPGKASPDDVSISKPYPWAKINIKC